MNVIKGFIVNHALVTNTPGVVAEFGELSTRSTTFSRERGIYSNPSYAGIELNAFYSVDEDIEKIEVAAEAQEHILAVGEYLYDRFNASSIANDIPQLIDDLETEFTAGTIEVTDFEMNELISSGAAPAKRLPDYLKWTMTETVSGNTYEITMWFSDEYFGLQYDEYEIVVVPPIANVDDFNATNAAVGATLAAATIGSITTRIQAAAGVHPYTILKSVPYTWHEPEAFGSATRQVFWNVLIYGPAGDSPDRIREVLRDWLLDEDNTEIDAGVWAVIFPQIFASIEYYLVPMWNRVSVGVPTVVYSPSFKTAGARARSILNVPFTADNTFWDTYLVATHFQYQDISSFVIGSPTNTVSGDFDFIAKFPDYINVPPSSLDYAKMSATTQGMAEFMNVLIELAERLTAATPNNLIPSGFSRVVRSGRVYATGSYDGTQYYMITKNSFNAS